MLNFYIYGHLLSKDWKNHTLGHIQQNLKKSKKKESYSGQRGEAGRGVTIPKPGQQGWV